MRENGGGGHEGSWLWAEGAGAREKELERERATELAMQRFCGDLLEIHPRAGVAFLGK